MPKALKQYCSTYFVNKNDHIGQAMWYEILKANCDFQNDENVKKFFDKLYTLLILNIFLVEIWLFELFNCRLALLDVNNFVGSYLS